MQNVSHQAVSPSSSKAVEPKKYCWAVETSRKDSGGRWSGGRRSINTVVSHLLSSLTLLLFFVMLQVCNHDFFFFYGFVLIFLIIFYFKFWFLGIGFRRMMMQCWCGINQRIEGIVTEVSESYGVCLWGLFSSGFLFFIISQISTFSSSHLF